MTEWNYFRAASVTVAAIRGMDSALSPRQLFPPIHSGPPGITVPKGPSGPRTRNLPAGIAACSGSVAGECRSTGLDVISHRKAKSRQKDSRQAAAGSRQRAAISPHPGGISLAIPQTQVRLLTCHAVLGGMKTGFSRPCERVPQDCIPWGMRRQGLLSLEGLADILPHLLERLAGGFAGILEGFPD